jgi:protein-tyrosine phosphatase
MRFSWIINDKLAASNIIRNEKEIRELKKKGITNVVCLVEEHELPFRNVKEYEEILSKYGIELKHFPIKDFYAPSLEYLIKIIKYIDEKIKENKKVLVHCYGGLGRTGTIVASFLVYYKKISAEEAINYVRRIRPGSVESYYQEEIVKRFEEYLFEKDFNL